MSWVDATETGSFCASLATAFYADRIEIVDERYELKRRLGSGAFSTVWLAHDRTVGIDVAVKILAENWATNEDICERFIGEARLAMQSQSSRMVRVLNAGQTNDGRPFMAMAYAAGGTLAERMQSRREAGIRFTLDEICSTGANLALALTDLHDRGLVHRDIKPANVLVYLEASGESLLLGDFGLARSLEDRATTFIAGSPGYIAPEQASGQELTARADLFPLGVILVEMCTGERVERSSVGDSFDFGRDIDRTKLSPVGLVDLLTELTDHDPSRRPESARQVAERLRNIAAAGSAPTIVASASDSVNPVTPSPPPALEKVSRRRVKVGAGVALAVAFGLGTYGINQIGGGTSQESQVEQGGIDLTVTPVLEGAQPVEGVSTAERPVLLLPMNIAAAVDDYEALDGWTRSPVTQNADGTLSFTMTGPRVVTVTLSPIGAQTTQVVIE